MAQGRFLVEIPKVLHNLATDMIFLSHAICDFEKVCLS